MLLPFVLIQTPDKTILIPQSEVDMIWNEKELSGPIDMLRQSQIYHRGNVRKWYERKTSLKWK